MEKTDQSMTFYLATLYRVGVLLWKLLCYGGIHSLLGAITGFHYIVWL